MGFRTAGKPIGELIDHTPHDSLVYRGLIFNANPHIHRVVFICTPHRGSNMAISSVGQLAMSLTRPSQHSGQSGVNAQVGNTLSAFTGSPKKMPNSVFSLSPKNPTLLVMDKVPIQAPYHSIIGDQGKGNTPNSSDGVVPYWSSHLDGAQSELIVPGPHGSCELPQNHTRRLTAFSCLTWDARIRETRPASSLAQRYEDNEATQDTRLAADRVYFSCLPVAWACGALYFADGPTKVLAGFLAGVALAVLVLVRSRSGKIFSVFGAILCTIVLAWWLTLKPTNHADWQPDVAQLCLEADLNGDVVTLHNVRNCDYRTDADYTPHWETRTVHLSQITGVDLAIDYWGVNWMAHPIMSFQLADAPPVCFSIETRRKGGQVYSALWRHFYRQFELIYLCLRTSAT